MPPIKNARVQKGIVSMWKTKLIIIYLDESPGFCAFR